MFAIKNIENFDFSRSMDSFFLNLKHIFDNTKTKINTKMLEEDEALTSLLNIFLKDFFDLIPNSYKNPSEFSKYLFRHCVDEYSDNKTISKSSIDEFVNEVKEYLEQYYLKAYQYLKKIDSLKDMVHTDGNYQYLLYFGSINFNTYKFPIFYIPLTLSINFKEVSMDINNIKANEKAFHYIYKDLSINKKAQSDMNDFDICEENKNNLQDIFNEFLLNLACEPITDLFHWEPMSKFVGDTQIKINKDMYIQLFETLEDGISNDYNKILHNHIEFMENFVHDLISHEHKASLEEEVNADWQKLDLESKLNLMFKEYRQDDEYNPITNPILRLDKGNMNVSKLIKPSNIDNLKPKVSKLKRIVCTNK